jgi:hypothetical protein
MRLHKDGASITCVEDWKRLAPPKADYHWVEGRSAFELAYAWCGSGAAVVPSDIQRLLDSRVETRDLKIDEVLPEHRIAFDARGGEPRNADVALVGNTSAAKVTVTIEAKADETFGATVAKTVADALERSVENPRSRGVERVQDLVRGILPPRSKGLPHVGGLRYQLLTAAAGTLAYAAHEKASLAVLIVHEFITDKTEDERRAQNAADLDRFVQRLAGNATAAIGCDLLMGPFSVPETSPFYGPALLIGKVASDRRCPQ